jgi:hypothetical protein
MVKKGKLDLSAFGFSNFCTGRIGLMLTYGPIILSVGFRVPKISAKNRLVSDASKRKKFLDCHKI